MNLFGENEFGIGEKLIRQIETGATRPNVKISDFEFIYKSKSTLLVKWKRIPKRKWCSSSTGSGDQRYSIMYRLKSGASGGTSGNEWTSVEVKKDKSSTLIEGIQEKKKYEFKYFASNRLGSGPVLTTDYKHVKTRRNSWPGLSDGDAPVELHSFQAYAVDHEIINVVWIPDPINMRPIKEFKISWGTEDPYEFEKTFDEKQFQKQFHQLTKLKPDTEYTISAVVYSGKDQQSEERFERVRTKALNEKPGEPINVSAKTKDATTIRVSWSDQIETGSESGSLDNGDLSSFLAKSGTGNEDKYYQIRLMVRNRSSVSRKSEKKPILFDVKTGKRFADVDNLRPYTTYDIDVR